MRLSHALGAAAVAALAAGAATAQDRVVNVYNWSDYIEEGVLDQFTEETGIEVRYDVFDSNELLETKLLAGGTGYDVVVPSVSFLERQIQAGVFQPLDKSKLPNLEHYWDRIAERVEAMDPENTYSVNYMWGTTGLGYNADKVREALGEDAPTDSAALLMEPENLKKLSECGVHFLDAPTELIPMMINYHGGDPNTRDPEAIREAGEKLEALTPYVTKFHSSNYISALANGEICAAIGWSGDVFQAQARAAEAGNNVEVAYSIPKEGAVMWFDQMAIPKDAPHPEAAHEFINFMLRPDIAAKNVNYVWYASGNATAREQIDPEIIGNEAIYPSDETMENLFVIGAYPPKAQRVLTRTWTEVKTGQ